MYIAASLLLTGALLCALLAAGAGALSSAGQVMTRTSGDAAASVSLPSQAKGTLLFLAELAQWLVLVLMTLACAALLYAFLTHDFSLEYVVHYSDRTLPVFYQVTAFWGGQSGSLLFWAWSVSISGAVFCVTPIYKRLTPATRLWFWVFFLSIMAFFLLLLTGWSDPFTPWRDRLGRIAVAPDGFGLNPMLQNPGMIFHPPLLFLGYGGFVVPGCLALAQATGGGRACSQAEPAWGKAARPFILVAWLLLTAGIILGAWWAYMELGWGGYWAWDPVENASLIPWLVATAYLHTAVVESRRGKLKRVNVFLMAMTTISAFFATYLVRSGVIESLHAFGSGTVGAPLLTFILAFLFLGLFIAIALPRGNAQPMEALHSKEGLLTLVAWALLALSGIILVATMWPVLINGLQNLSGFMPISWAILLADAPTGLDAGFYNRTCLPLFAGLSILLLICPFRKWTAVLEGNPVRLSAAFTLVWLSILVPLSPWNLQFSTKGPDLVAVFSSYAPITFILGIVILTVPLRNASDVQHPRLFQATLAMSLLFALQLFRIGVDQPAALVAASCSFAACFGLIGLFAASPGLFRARGTLAAHGVHIGLLMIVIGVCFSGPYQADHTLMMREGQTLVRGEYSFTLQRLHEGASPAGDGMEANFRYLQADVIVRQNGQPVGILYPQRRQYAKFEQQPFAEVSTLFSLGNEIYATLLSYNSTDGAAILVHVNPLVNWLWIGGVLMSLFPLLSLRSGRKKEEDAGGNASGGQGSTLDPAGE